ncbi:MAG TPA: HD-GYP domain-containing protein [Caulifigura sp.]|nr:HD-GYP domain-containing protein [Caulifigura sp.]
MTVMVESIEAPAADVAELTRSALADELAAIAQRAFDAPCHQRLEVVFSESVARSGLLSGVAFFPTPRGCNVELTVETEQGTLLQFAAEVPEPLSPALRRLAHVTHTAMQQHLLLAEQNEHLARHAAQVSHDFDMLVSMRELAERMQDDGPGVAATDVVQSLLPCLRDMLRASEVLFVECPVDLGRDENTAAHLTLVHRYGESTLADDELLELVLRQPLTPTQEPIVLNDHGVTNLRLDNDISSIIFVDMSASPGANGWLVATRTNDEWIRGKREQRIGDREFGTIEAGLLKSVATFLSSHGRTVQLFREQERLLVGVVRAMVNAIDAKDSYTCGHSDRVAVVARTLASQLGLSEVECDRIYLTGLLHDIGKIGVPDSVLLKAGKLTDEEFAMIKKHPVIGYNVLSHLDEIEYVLPGVLHHHESLDGKGYPSGLKGLEIPFEARILAVADSFDAMTSTRPYREGMSLDKASNILQASAGIQWDANVVAAFFACRDKIVEACERANHALQDGEIHYHDDNIARAVLSVRTG